MDTWEIVARERIRDTVASYAVAGDGNRLEELAALFTESGVLEVKGRGRAVGRREIIEMLSVAGRRKRPTEAGFFIRHFVTDLRFVRVEPARAETTAYFVVFTRSGADHWGRYRDVLVPHGEQWLFAHRLVAVDAAAAGSWHDRGDE